MLVGWGGRLRAGLFPTQLAEDTTGELATNSADAPLLFIRALSEWEAIAGKDVPESLSQAADLILDAWTDGTQHGIRIDPTGLVVAGQDGEALTWMDAIVGGVPVTPRTGSPIELQAYLVESLLFCHKKAEQRSDLPRAKKLKSLLGLAEKALANRFVDATCQELVDRLDSAGQPESSEVRPNVLFAMRGCSRLFPREVLDRTLLRLEAELVTPFGLRSLSPHHPYYHGVYAGDQPARDRAYHQGTVWPWLVGAYCDSVFAVRGDSKAVREDLMETFAPLFETLRESSMIPELFDGDEPHAPKGCPNQAWSVAEVLRVASHLGVPIP
jgi:predicted glycogen debranching enzyme